jgi:hypothetical protein
MDSNRFTGTVVGCGNLSSLWPDSSWRHLKVIAGLMSTSAIMVFCLVPMEWRFAPFLFFYYIGVLG